MSDEQQKIIFFKIIKHLHSAHMQGKNYVDYEELINELQSDQGTIVHSLKALGRLGYLTTNRLTATLTPKAMNVIENYHPKNYNEFVSNYNKHEDVKEKHSKTRTILSIIIPILIFIGIIIPVGWHYGWF